MVKHLPCRTFRTSLILYNVLFDNFSIVGSDRISFRSKAWEINSFSVKKGPTDLNATPGHIVKAGRLISFTIFSPLAIAVRF